MPVAAEIGWLLLYSVGHRGAAHVGGLVGPQPGGSASAFGVTAVDVFSRGFAGSAGGAL
jgi:hypothetical protein